MEPEDMHDSASTYNETHVDEQRLASPPRSRSPSASSSTLHLAYASEDEETMHPQQQQHDETVVGRIKRIPSLIKHFVATSSHQSQHSHHQSSASHHARGERKAWSVAPPSYTADNAIQALKDSVRSAPTHYGPSMDSLPHPIKFSRRYFSSQPPSPPETPDESESDGSPPTTPPSEPTFDPNTGLPLATAANGARRSSWAMSKHSTTMSSNGRLTSTHSHSVANDPLAVNGSVVMMGGYRGSVLRDVTTKRRVWLTSKHYSGWRQMDVGIRLSEEDEINSHEKVVAEKMMTKFMMVDMGHRLKQKFKSISSAQRESRSRHFLPFLSGPRQPLDLAHPPLAVESFGYDFRKSPEIASRELVEHLTLLKEQSAARGEGVDGKGLGAILICHSMGGLVALHALASSPDPTIFRGIVFAGTPFQGAVNILGPFKLDQEYKRNVGVGSPEIVFSWRSSFYFLPRGPYYGTAESSSRPPSPDSPTMERISRSRRTSVTEPASPPAPSSTSTSNSSKGPLDHCWQSHSEPPTDALIHGCFEDPAGNPIPVDFYDPETWSSHALSPITAGLYGPMVNGETADRRAVQIERRELRRKGGLFNRSTSGNGRGSRGGGGQIHVPLPGGPGTMGDSAGISRDGFVARALEQGEEVVNDLEGGGADDDYVPIAVEEDLKDDAVVDQYLRRTLERAKKFHEDIEKLYDPAKEHLYPRFAVIASRSMPTVRGVLVESRESIPNDLYPARLYGHGDGVALWESCVNLPGRWSQHLDGVALTTHGHISMLSDLASVRRAFEILDLAR